MFKVNRVVLLLALSLSVSMTAPAAAVTLYVGVVRLLTPDGPQTSYLKATGIGVSLQECEVKRQAWLEQNGEGLKQAKAQLLAKGLPTEFTVTCEPK